MSAALFPLTFTTLYESPLVRVEDLTDLALDLGFSSHSHFTDAFRKEFGAKQAMADPPKYAQAVQ